MTLLLRHVSSLPFDLASIIFKECYSYAGLIFFCDA